MNRPIDWTTPDGQCRECGGPGQLWLVPDGDAGETFIGSDLCEEHAIADSDFPWEPVVALLLEEAFEVMLIDHEATEGVEPTTQS